MRTHILIRSDFKTCMDILWNLTSGPNIQKFVTTSRLAVDEYFKSM
jgi:hypothetical protein